VKENHVYILETPLFRVRNKQETIYCYDENEKQKAIKKLGGKPEITRFKGLGEISPDEFAGFIGKDIKLQPVIVMPETHVQQILEYFMGKNTPERQEFIIGNLKIELDKAEDGKPMANE
jgi:topoisomerase-4 subunit B